MIKMIAGLEDMSHLVPLDDFIVDMQKISKRYGNIPVYVRRGGITFDTNAIKARDNDEKDGVFFMQEIYEKNMKERADQVQRLIERVRELEGGDD